MNMTLHDLFSHDVFSHWANRGDAMILLEQQRLTGMRRTWRVLTQFGTLWCFEEDLE